MSKTNGFLDWIPNCVEYANPTSIDINSSGWCITYIASTFLNGWINYVKPMKAFVVHRYFEGNQYELEAKVWDWNSKKHIHSNLRELEDDILMLCQDEKGDYWYFWFDNDVSDCSIGRFKVHQKDDSEDQKEFDKTNLISEFEEFVKSQAGVVSSYHNGPPAFFEVDVTKIQGWVSF